jgi:predicted DNA-binding transcriptional regulator AlpA
MANTKAIHAGPTLSELLLIEEVADLTRLPLSTLRFYRHRGDGGPKSFKLGNRVVYRRADVEQWIESQYQAEGVR